MYLLRGKMSAFMARRTPEDLADIYHLLRTYPDEIKEIVHLLDQVDVTGFLDAVDAGDKQQWCSIFGR